MDEKSMHDVLLFGGGIISDSDKIELRKLGIGELFTPGTSTIEIVDYVVKWVSDNRQNQ